jgi:DNA invertase Pin-like site-specific DNA recombinase
MVNNACILLTRVSTPGQELDPQIDDLKQYARSKGLDVFHIIETKESGLINYQNREGTNELYDYIMNNSNYRTVICTELSRLGRSEADLHCMKEWLIKNKIQFYLKDRDYRLFDDNGTVNESASLMFTMYGYFAENEMRTKKDRFKRGRQYYNKMGVSHSGKLLFGYQKVPFDEKRKKYELNEKESSEIQQIYFWYAHGIDANTPNPSIKQIALHCIKKGFSNYTHIKRNVNKLLKEEAYLGFKITNNKRKNPLYSDNNSEPKYIQTNSEIKYPVIINQELFNLVQENLRTNTVKADKATIHITLLAKLVICPECSRFLQGEYRRRNKQINYAYRCSATRNIIKCSYNKYFSMQMLDSAIWSTIKSDLSVLATEIIQNNPNNLINTLKEEELHLQTRHKKLEERFRTENQFFEKVRKMQSFNFDEQFDKFTKIMDKLEREKYEVDQALNGISIRIKLMENEQAQNYEQIIKGNIIAIEQNKSLLQQYIRLFVENVTIHYHDFKHTVIEICFKKVSKILHQKHENGRYSYPDLPLERKTFVAIDKTNTQKILMRKINKRFFASKNGLFINQKKIDYVEIFTNSENLNKKFKMSDGNNIFDIIEYNKINLYPSKVSA